MIIVVDDWRLNRSGGFSCFWRKTRRLSKQTLQLSAPLGNLATKDATIDVFPEGRQDAETETTASGGAMAKSVVLASGGRSEHSRRAALGSLNRVVQQIGFLHRHDFANPVADAGAADFLESELGLFVGQTAELQLGAMFRQPNDETPDGLAKDHLRLFGARILVGQQQQVAEQIGVHVFAGLGVAEQPVADQDAASRHQIGQTKLFLDARHLVLRGDEAVGQRLVNGSHGFVELFTDRLQPNKVGVG